MFWDKNNTNSEVPMALGDTVVGNLEQGRDFLTNNKSSLDEFILPSGIDASNYDHLEIFSKKSKYARTFYISAVPRMATFVEFLNSMYDFGDINVSVHIEPINEADSQKSLNKYLVGVESEMIDANKKGDNNRYADLSLKYQEADKLRNEIASGFNKLFEVSVLCTIFADDLDELDKASELLAMEMSKKLISVKTAWAIQEDAFKSNMPIATNKVGKKHTFDKSSVSTVFPFTATDIGHPSGIPLGYNVQTGVPILFDNFHQSLTNYNMVVFGKSGAGKGVTIKVLSARSSVLMGIETLALDAEGEYAVVAEALGGINVTISPTSKTVINIFDIEPEIIRDEVTGRERTTLQVENKVEDITQALLTMARGSTKSRDVNELTKQIIAETVSEEYKAIGINSNPDSLFEIVDGTKTRKKLPTISSWYHRLVEKAEENDNEDYNYQYSYLTKVMKQYIREFDGSMAYFDGQSTFNLNDNYPFVNLDISQLEERFARPLAQQILMSWIWEKYVKKNSEDKKKARKKRVIVDEAWMMLPYPEAVDFLNTMARRARKRNVSLAVVSQKFQDFYEVKEAQAVLTSSDTKLFLAQDKAEIEYLREVFKLSKGEADFLATCGRGQGLLKVGSSTAILQIVPTQKEFEFVETNPNKIAAREEEDD
ncbi:MAG: DUF87 domain-containing protein [Clostridiales bacterium]|nr:DUF87 domain-containing protein [Clostridiales bacterium]